MGKKTYVFDSNSFNVDKEERKGRKIITTILGVIVASISLTVIYYFFFAIFFNTDQERALKNENKMLEKMYPEMYRKTELLSDVVEGLKIRDRQIYSNIFEAESPELDKALSVNVFPLTDTLLEEDIVKLTEAKADVLLENAGQIEKNMRRIFEICGSDGFSAPPMGLPVEDFSLSMTGASVGKKVNPFYKVLGEHEGIDFMANLGTKVMASAAGTVSSIDRSRKGLGNVVTIDHGHGYLSRYAHLQDIEVRVGNRVEKGQVIGYVGMSGASYAPHLHYEIRKDGKAQDPVNYFFATVSPHDYAGMYIMSVLTGQSLD